MAGTEGGYVKGQSISSIERRLRGMALTHAIFMGDQFDYGDGTPIKFNSMFVRGDNQDTPDAIRLEPKRRNRR